MSTLDENAIRALLPKPNVAAPAPPVATSIPGTIANTNPPAQGSGDALIFDPDENITYDSLQTMQRTGNETPFVPQYNVPSVQTTSSPNVLDLAPSTQAATASGYVSSLKFWVMLIASILIASFVIFLLMRSSKPSASPNAARGLDLNQIYGGR
ncbi:MAG: hypothetical protein ACO35C_04350 [Pontimonas sp.]